MVEDELARMIWTLSDDVSALPVDPSPHGADPSDPDATPPAPVMAPDHSHRRWMAAALAIVLVGAALAGLGLLLGRERAAPGATGSAGGGAATSSTAAGTSAANTLSPPAPVEVVGLAEFDPPPAGDGRENPKRLGNLTDSDPGTSWATVCYQTPVFAPKQGVGLVLELSRPPDGATLEVHTPMVGWSVDVFEARTAGDDLEAWGQPVGGGRAIEGPLRVQLASRNDRYVLVLLTRGTRAGRCSEQNPYAGEVTDLVITP
jgi:hypothetical protein